MSDFDSFDDLKQTPEEKALAVPIGGLELPWLPTVAAAERAESKGHALGDILDGLSALSELADADEEQVGDMIDGFNDGMSALSRLVWYGFLTFEPDLDLRVVEQHIDQESVQDIPAAEMTDRLLPDAEEAEGKPKEGKGRGTS